MKKNERFRLKNAQKKFVPSLQVIVFLFVLMLIAGTGCKKDEEAVSTSSQSDDEVNAARQQLLLAAINVTNLVSDTTSYGATFIDSNLVNAWGLAFSSSGAAWVSSTERGVSTVYDRQGVTLRPPATIPSPGQPDGGEPTGVVYNTTLDFLIPGTGLKSRFIFVGEDGIVSAWRSGNNAIIVADRSPFDAVYKGVAIANSNGSNYLYATNFKGGAIDVFDASFNHVSGFSFTDPNMPAGYAPFNIKKYGNNKLIVTYAKQLAPDNEDDEAGPGFGYVDIYNTDGTLDHRFASQGALNAPWGIADVQSCHSGFLQGRNRILIGNFGDGRINIYEEDGTLVGPLSMNGTPIEIEGLWAIVFPPSGTGNNSVLYFTAGPDEEEHGLFGYISN